MKGVLVATTIILLWLFTFSFGITYSIDSSNFLVYVCCYFPIQTFLYTGLFITAHDGMHGSIHTSLKWNRRIATVCLWLFCFNRFSILLPKHWEHHKYPATDKDPDYSPFGFWRWYLSFLKMYITWYQIMLMAIVFNILLIYCDQTNLIFAIVLSPILSTLQLFYFGTYLPHKGHHDNKHNARTLKYSRLVGFLTCYNFGYHFEHHDQPSTPWWKLKPNDLK